MKKCRERLLFTPSKKGSTGGREAHSTGFLSRPLAALLNVSVRRLTDEPGLGFEKNS